MPKQYGLWHVSHPLDDSRAPMARLRGTGTNVNTTTWMRLAVDLVMKSPDHLAQQVVSKAFAHWQLKVG
ncbi:hypothetical protein AHAS_Ahas05G0262100 [Arachis hypogaea]